MIEHLDTYTKHEVEALPIDKDRGSKRLARNDLWACSWI